MRWNNDRFVIEMIDEPCYTFGSADNVHVYERESLFQSKEYRPSSRHGVRCFEGEEPRGSVVLGGSGAGSSVNERSCVMFADRCLVGIGNGVVALSLPDLNQLWQVEVDVASCFGLHALPDESGVIVHGELVVRRLSADGRTVWEFGGKDIFTGPFAIRGGVIFAADFYDNEYRIDLESGKGELTRSGRSMD
jgi:hypothetical protein